MGFITKHIDTTIEPIVDDLQTAIKEREDPDWLAAVPILGRDVASPDVGDSFSESVDNATRAATQHDSGLAQLTCVFKVAAADTVGDPENGPSFKFDHIDTLGDPPHELAGACMDWYYEHNGSIEETRGATFRYLESFYLRLIISPDQEIADYRLLAKYTDE